MLKKYDGWIRYVLCVAYACIFSIMLSEMTALNLNNDGIGVCAFVVSSVFFLIFNLPYGHIIYPIFYGASVLLAAAIYAVRLWISDSNIAEDFNYVINLLVRYETVPKIALEVVFYFITVFIAMSSVLMLGRKLHFVCASLSAAVAVFGALFTASAGSYTVFMVMIGLLCVICAFSVYMKQASDSRATGVSARGLIPVIASLVCVAVMVAVSLPVYNTDSEVFSVEMLSRDYYKHNGEGEFSLGQYHIGEEDRLGGQRKTDNNIALTVKSDYPFYAVASYKDYYNGSNWLVSDHHKMLYQSSSDINLDARIQSAVLMNSGFDVYENHITVTYNGLISRSAVRAPLTLDFPKFKDDTTKLYFDRNDNLYTNETMGRGFSYSITSVAYDLNEVYEFLASDAYTQSIAVARGIISREEYTDHLEQIYNQYTAIPYSMPERIDLLSYRIVKEADASSRIEKVLAMVDYLKDYQYTVDCVDLPNNSDFVDHFLFETKKGYCTYFASALAMLARTQGIPARYCEGYSPAEQGGEYELKNNMLHAWAEVYFDGFGWVVFEATPPSAGNIDHITVSGAANGMTPDKITNSTVSDNPTQDPEKQETVAETPEQPEKQEKPALSSNARAVAVMVAVAVVIGVLSAVIIMLSAVRIIRERRMDSLDHGQYILAVWRQVLKLAKFDGADVAQSHTVRKQNEIFDQRYAKGCSLYNETFEKVMYSTEQASEVDRRNAARFYQHIDGAVKRRQGGCRYVMAKYLLHKI